MRGEVDGYNCRMWVRNYFFDVRLVSDARINCDLIIGCTYKSERTLAYDIIYVR